MVQALQPHRNAQHSVEMSRQTMHYLTLHSHPHETTDAPHAERAQPVMREARDSCGDEGHLPASSLAFVGPVGGEYQIASYHSVAYAPCVKVLSTSLFDPLAAILYADG